jgi:hypothetical protein
MSIQGYLAPGVHATRRDADIVFLNVAADRYVCLPGGADGLQLQASGAVRIAQRDLADDLSAAGLLADALGERRTPPPSLPRRSALRDAYDPPRFEDMIPISRAVADVLRHYQRRSFARILAGVAAGPARPRDPQITSALISAVDRYHRWSPYAPLSGKCLLRGFVMLRALRREGLDAVWVFGVRTWPFHAHCWLQVEDMVLDDHHDRVGAYTPLMAV